MVDQTAGAAQAQAAAQTAQQAADQAAAAAKAAAEAPTGVQLLGGGLIATGLSKVADKFNITNPLIKEFNATLGEAGKIALQFSGISKELTTSVEAFGSLLKGDISKGLSNLNEQVQKQIKAYQTLDVEFIKLGRGENSRGYIESIRQQQFETQKLGIGITELLTANQNLLKLYIGAIPLTERQTTEFEKNRKELGLLTTFYDKFAIAQTESIKVFSTFNLSMVGGTREAQKFSDALLIFSQKTGQQANNVFTEFNSNIDRFSVLGSAKALETFQKLDMAAVRLGTNVSKVVSSIQKFDDIEEGFQAGGQLNRVLSFMGGSFDTFRAIQASDEERAQMLFQAISGVASNYQALQTTAAKRSFAKQIVESTGLDMQQVLGLLNKSTNVAEDLSEIYKKPVVSEEFTAEGRERASVRVTTTEQMAKIQGSLFDLNPVIVRLSDVLQRNTVAATTAVSREAELIDKKYLGPLTKGGLEAFKEAGKQFYKDVADLPNKYKKLVEDYNQSQKIQFDSVVNDNTVAFKGITDSTKSLNTILAKGIEVKVTGELKGPTGSTPVKGETRVNDAAAGTPPPR